MASALVLVLVVLVVLASFALHSEDWSTYIRRITAHAIEYMCTSSYLMRCGGGSGCAGSYGVPSGQNFLRTRSGQVDSDKKPYLSKSNQIKSTTQDARRAGTGRGIIICHDSYHVARGLPTERGFPTRWTVGHARTIPMTFTHGKNNRLTSDHDPTAAGEGPSIPYLRTKWPNGMRNA